MHHTAGILTVKNVKRFLLIDQKLSKQVTAHAKFANLEKELTMKKILLLTLICLSSCADPTKTKISTGFSVSESKLNTIEIQIWNYKGKQNIDDFAFAEGVKFAKNNGLKSCEASSQEQIKNLFKMNIKCER